jgi:hypothetical protein
MTSGKMPVRIDVIEQLYGDGEVTVEMVSRMAGNQASAWGVISSLVAEHIATLFVLESGMVRPLVEWEVSALLRNRLHHSTEVTPHDDCLLLRHGEKMIDAYEREFGDWYRR